MKRALCILMLSVAVSCSKEPAVKPVSQGVAFVFSPAMLSGSATRADADNLAVEYAIGNLSVFLAEAGSDQISYKYVYQSFAALDNTTIQNPKLVTLPLTQGALPAMDVYVVANCYDQSALDAVATLADLDALQTAKATSQMGFTIRSGLLPMFGQVAGADLNVATPDAPLAVQLTRAIAKFRVTLTFPDAGWVGTGNIYGFKKCAPYTCFVPGNIPALSSSQLIDYPSHSMLATGTAGQFQGEAYIFEATTPPELHILTTVGGVAKEYIASLQFPFPVRNYLYDIEVRIYKPLGTTRADGAKTPAILYSSEKVIIFVFD